MDAHGARASGRQQLQQLRQAAAATQLSKQVSFLPFAASATHQPEHRTTWRCDALAHPLLRRLHCKDMRIHCGWER
jgi:hypothetical protein